MSKVRYGLIGFGGIAHTRLVPEGFALDRSRFEPLAEAELIAATSRNPERRQAVESLGLVWHESVDSLLADPEIEAVFISTNNLTHAPLAKRALEAGKHCLLEKPITTAIADLEELQRLAADKNLSLAVNHMMVHNAYNRRARRLIAEQALGAVNDLCLHMEFLYGSTPEEAAAWRCADPEELGGPIGDVGSHCLYMAEYLMDASIESLSCTYLPRTLEITVENGAFIQFELSTGIDGSIRVAFNQPRGGDSGTLENLGYEIYGSRAILRGYGTLFQLSGHEREPLPLRLEIDSFTATDSIRISDCPNIYQEVIRRHARSIREQKPMDGADALHNLELVLACHRSASKQGQKIRIASHDNN